MRTGVAISVENRNENHRRRGAGDVAGFCGNAPPGCHRQSPWPPHSAVVATNGLRLLVVRGCRIECKINRASSKNLCAAAFVRPLECQYVPFQLLLTGSGPLVAGAVHFSTHSPRNVRRLSPCRRSLRHSRHVRCRLRRLCYSWFVRWRTLQFYWGLEAFDES
jgi:hypothetical protein